MEKLCLCIFVSKLWLSSEHLHNSALGAPNSRLVRHLDFSEHALPKHIWESHECQMCNMADPNQLWLLRKDHCPLRDPGKEGAGCRSACRGGRSSTCIFGGPASSPTVTHAPSHWAVLKVTVSVCWLPPDNHVCPDWESPLSLCCSSLPLFGAYPSLKPSSFRGRFYSRMV